MLWLIGKDDGEGYETKRQALTAQYQQRSNFIDCFSYALQPNTNCTYLYKTGMKTKDIPRIKQRQR